MLSSSPKRSNTSYRLRNAFTFLIQNFISVYLIDTGVLHNSFIVFWTWSLASTKSEDQLTFSSLPILACHISPPFVILLYFSQYFCIHLITDCRCVWYQPLLFLYSELHLNKCDTTRDGQQQPWHGTKTVQRVSVRLLMKISFLLLHCYLPVMRFRLLELNFGSRNVVLTLEPMDDTLKCPLQVNVAGQSFWRWWLFNI